MLRLRRATVLVAGPPSAMEQRLSVDIDGTRRSAIADIGLVGAAQAGDELIVNVEAVELGLGSGGFDIVHVNLTRGLDGAGTPRAHVMKLNYTSLQHAVTPVEEGDANAFEAHGLHCTNLANGTEYNHEHRERVSIAALEGMLDVAFALLDACSD